jgi:hypothetical protein
MKKYFVSLAAIAAMTVATPAIAKNGNGNGHGAHKAAKHQKKHSDRLDRIGYEVRGRDAQRAGRSCPPGLAKKNNGCLPPGQAKKFGVGDRLPSYLSRYNVPEQYRDRYYDDGNYSYRYEDDNIYRVNRGSGMIDQIISVLGL